MGDNEESILTRVHNDMRDMKLAMSQMAEAITRLAVLEEKHLGVVNALQRVEDQVDKLDDKVQNLSLQIAEAQGRASGAGWVIKSVWGVVGAAVIGMLAWAAKSIFGAPVL